MLLIDTMLITIAFRVPTINELKMSLGDATLQCLRKWFENLLLNGDTSVTLVNTINVNLKLSFVYLLSLSQAWNGSFQVLALHQV